MKKPKSVKARKVYIGIVNDNPYFYADTDFYDGVIHGDMFKTKKAAKKCYGYVVPFMLTPLTSTKK